MLGVFLDSNHEALLKEDVTYKMWYEKRIAIDTRTMMTDFYKQLTSLK